MADVEFGRRTVGCCPAICDRLCDCLVSFSFCCFVLRNLRAIGGVPVLKRAIPIGSFMAARCKLFRPHVAVDDGRPLRGRSATPPTPQAPLAGHHSDAL